MPSRKRGPPLASHLKKQLLCLTQPQEHRGTAREALPAFSSRTNVGSSRRNGFRSPRQARQGLPCPRSCMVITLAQLSKTFVAEQTQQGVMNAVFIGTIKASECAPTSRLRAYSVRCWNQPRSQHNSKSDRIARSRRQNSRLGQGPSAVSYMAHLRSFPGK
jgi:hypothetical protein